VFKIIRDQFAYPKDIARRQAEEKYRLVFRYDRIGRLVDAQEFRHLRFPKARFEQGMLEELLGQCAETVSLEGDEVLVRHCYIERRLRPLNLFVREAPADAALKAMLDYGQAIKDLARSNIFRATCCSRTSASPVGARSSTTTTSCACSRPAASATCPRLAKAMRQGRWTSG
jgi:isocitrate dehydrogenase kinase/phosphatase